MVPYQPARIRAAEVKKTIRLADPASPPPAPDFLFTGYPGAIGVLEAAAVLTVTVAAAWAGIRTGMGQGSKTLKVAGWVGGVGSALIGLLYLGGKSGLGSQVGLPAVRVTPS